MITALRRSTHGEANQLESSRRSRVVNRPSQSCRRSVHWFALRTTMPSRKDAGNAIRMLVQELHSTSTATRRQTSIIQAKNIRYGCEVEEERWAGDIDCGSAGGLAANSIVHWASNWRLVVWCLLRTTGDYYFTRHDGACYRCIAGHCAYGTTGVTS